MPLEEFARQFFARRTAEAEAEAEAPSQATCVQQVKQPPSAGDSNGVTQHSRGPGDARANAPQAVNGSGRSTNGVDGVPHAAVPRAVPTRPPPVPLGSLNGGQAQLKVVSTYLKNFTADISEDAKVSLALLLQVAPQPHGRQSGNVRRSTMSDGHINRVTNAVPFSQMFGCSTCRISTSTRVFKRPCLSEVRKLLPTNLLCGRCG